MGTHDGADLRKYGLHGIKSICCDLKQLACLLLGSRVHHRQAKVGTPIDPLLKNVQQSGLGLGASSDPIHRLKDSILKL